MYSLLYCTITVITSELNRIFLVSEYYLKQQGVSLSSLVKLSYNCGLHLFVCLTVPEVVKKLESEGYKLQKKYECEQKKEINISIPWDNLMDT